VALHSISGTAPCYIRRGRGLGTTGPRPRRGTPPPMGRSSRVGPMFSGGRFTEDPWVRREHGADGTRGRWGSRGWSFVRENHTMKKLVRSMRCLGVCQSVADGWPVQPNPPTQRPSRTPVAYAKWLNAANSAGTRNRGGHAQFDHHRPCCPLTTPTSPPTGRSSERNHCSGFGHQSSNRPTTYCSWEAKNPTLRNPPRSPAPTGMGHGPSILDTH